jgi:hypothetical protein
MCSNRNGFCLPGPTNSLASGTDGDEHGRVVSERALPLQGGLPPVAEPPGPPGTDLVEVACDESGFSGSNMLDAATPVITHASVDLDVGEAVDLVGTLRSRFGFSASEPKAGPFLRGPHAAASLAWFLKALDGRGHVVLVDKQLFLATRIVHLFLGDPTYTSGSRLSEDVRHAALTLHRAGRVGTSWDCFLAAFADLVRTKRASEPGALDRFLDARDALRSATSDDEAAEVLGRLTRHHVDEIVRRLVDDDRSIPPPLEPLLPALAETVLFWSGGRRRVLVVHDEQSALTADRLRRLQDSLADSISPLAGLVMVDSRRDPRVQVADLLAGLARRAPASAGGALATFVSPASLYVGTPSADRLQQGDARHVVGHREEVDDVEPA